MKLTETSEELTCSIHFEVSPVGGDAMYIMAASPTAPKDCARFTKLDDGLLFWDEFSLTSLVYLDFSTVTFTELQFPKYEIKEHNARGAQELSVPLISWDCRRLY